MFPRWRSRVSLYKSRHPRCCSRSDGHLMKRKRMISLSLNYSLLLKKRLRLPFNKTMLHKQSIRQQSHLRMRVLLMLNRRRTTNPLESLRKKKDQATQHVRHDRLMMLVETLPNQLSTLATYSSMLLKMIWPKSFPDSETLKRSNWYGMHVVCQKGSSDFTILWLLCCKLTLIPQIWLCHLQHHQRSQQRSRWSSSTTLRRSSSECRVCHHWCSKNRDAKKLRETHKPSY